MRRNLEGILEMDKLPDALIIIDTTREQNAVNEARRLGVPIVGIVDTNADPEMIDYPIPGNDDAIRAIRVMLQKLVDAIVSASGEACSPRGEVEMFHASRLTTLQFVDGRLMGRIAITVLLFFNQLLINHEPFNIYGNQSSTR